MENNKQRRRGRVNKAKEQQRLGNGEGEGEKKLKGEGQRGGLSEVGVEHKKEIEGFHLATASLCLSAQRVIKEAANRVL